MPRKGPRRPQRKPKGKEQFCWSWRRGKKALGLRLEAQGDLAGAAACHCQKPAGENGRCQDQGGLSSSRVARTSNRLAAV